MLMSQASLDTDMKVLFSDPDHFFLAHKMLIFEIFLCSVFGILYKLLNNFLFLILAHEFKL